ncbi:MAG: chemotaxis protein CheR [Actinobacteria bacterium]|jgi:chemotaxis protein methyltransferase CheR|uniref:protein-glutamate O-methyltransferase n=1 Tax=freshwater metagenome TaxID=449393 RepID=A0A6J6EJV2_9ZZZZ|nr:chemotaxis protein CheR [Actinomycetota bacterium]
MSIITASQFDHLREMVLRESAIVLEPGKEYLVESRLAPIARREGLGSVSELVHKLMTSPSAKMTSEIIDAMTTNETSFFRDVHPWQTLKEEILPKLIESRRIDRRLSVWCAACSSGQEPYSLAMLLRDTFPDIVKSWDVTIIATDLSDSMLYRCREGVYSQLEVNRGLPAPMLVRNFQREGADWRIDPELRRMVDVRTCNLAVPNSYPRAASRFDLVFIRNVLIYFDEATKTKILNETSSRMQSDGYLLLGSSEVSISSATRLVRHQFGRTIYFQPS